MEPRDEIRIEGLRCPARIGVSAAENSRPQTLVLDLRLRVDLRPAGLSDDLKDTIDYQAVAEGVRTLARSRPFRLLEALAEAVCGHLLSEYPRLEGVSVLFRKYPKSMREMVSCVAVEMSRRRDAY